MVNWGRKPEMSGSIMTSKNSAQVTLLTWAILVMENVQKQIKNEKVWFWLKTVTYFTALIIVQLPNVC